jgi:light-regulated signal transduction histidine kinase (bacteriophytochrome)
MYNADTDRYYNVHAFSPGQGRFAVIFRDITDRKQAEKERELLTADLERRVEERTSELKAANQELENFTFATSHDLKGPLGRINSFATLLERNYRDRLEGDGLVFLELIRQNAMRLTQLVDDLLNYSRISQQRLDLQAIDVAKAVQAIVQDKAGDLQGSKAEIQIDLPQMTVLADPLAFQQALGNLVENALKYSSQAAQPHIEISGAVVGNRVQIRVIDNGIGFDMKYHDRIFEIFKRLHTQSEYTGSGVGLALVKRAVERMGGRIWAESAPGQGASFFLELQITT